MTTRKQLDSMYSQQCLRRRSLLCLLPFLVAVSVAAHSRASAQSSQGELYDETYSVPQAPSFDEAPSAHFELLPFGQLYPRFEMNIPHEAIWWAESGPNRHWAHSCAKLERVATNSVVVTGTLEQHARLQRYFAELRKNQQPLRVELAVTDEATPAITAGDVASAGDIGARLGDPTTEYYSGNIPLSQVRRWGSTTYIDRVRDVEINQTGVTPVANAKNPGLELGKQVELRMAVLPNNHLAVDWALRRRSGELQGYRVTSAMGGMDHAHVVEEFLSGGGVVAPETWTCLGSWPVASKEAASSYRGLATGHRALWIRTSAAFTTLPMDLSFFESDNGWPYECVSPTRREQPSDSAAPLSPLQDSLDANDLADRLMEGVSLGELSGSWPWVVAQARGKLRDTLQRRFDSHVRNLRADMSYALTVEFNRTSRESFLSQRQQAGLSETEASNTATSKQENEAERVRTTLLLRPGVVATCLSGQVEEYVGETESISGCATNIVEILDPIIRTCGSGLECRAQLLPRGREHVQLSLWWCLAELLTMEQQTVTLPMTVNTNSGDTTRVVQAIQLGSPRQRLAEQRHDLVIPLDEWVALHSELQEESGLRVRVKASLMP